jgi:hypothetical protein
VEKEKFVIKESAVHLISIRVQTTTVVLEGVDYPIVNVWHQKHVMMEYVVRMTIRVKTTVMEERITVAQYVHQLYANQWDEKLN